VVDGSSIDADLIDRHRARTPARCDRGTGKAENRRRSEAVSLSFVRRSLMRTYAVVVNWNGGNENLACVRSLLDQGLAPDEIVFVDNGSTRGTLDQVISEFPGLTLVRNDVNTGFALASNQGMEIALERGAAYVFLVNNDVEIPSGSLNRLTEALASDPSLGIVGPRILYLEEPERIWCAGGLLNFRQNLTRLLGHKKPDGPRWQTTVRVDFVPGCAMLIRRDVIERIGMFDAELFAYHEDLDLCVKTLDAGWGIACIGQEHAFHNPHSSTGGGYNRRRK
jgi:GT2 family glycosyltransferase